MSEEEFDLENIDLYPEDEEEEEGPIDEDDDWLSSDIDEEDPEEDLPLDLDNIAVEGENE